jgi:hypothetical protein
MEPHGKSSSRRVYVQLYHMTSTRGRKSGKNNKYPSLLTLVQRGVSKKDNPELSHNWHAQAFVDVLWVGWLVGLFVCLVVCVLLQE